VDAVTEAAKALATQATETLNERFDSERAGGIVEQLQLQLPEDTLALVALLYVAPMAGTCDAGVRLRWLGSPPSIGRRWYRAVYTSSTRPAKAAFLHDVTTLFAQGDAAGLRVAPSQGPYILGLGSAPAPCGSSQMAS